MCADCGCSINETQENSDDKLENIQANPQLERRRFIYPTMILKIPVKNYNLPQCQSGFSFLKNRNQRRTKSRKEEIPANIGNNNKRKNSNFWAFKKFQEDYHSLKKFYLSTSSKERKFLKIRKKIKTS